MIMEKPPAYSEFESLRPAQTLPEHLTQARATRINSTISSHVLPYLEEAVTSGLSGATIILLPPKEEDLQNELDTKGDKSAPEVIGFPSSDNVRVIQLQGKENAPQFWRQPMVSRELGDMLKNRLELSGHSIWTPSETKASIPSPSFSPPGSVKKGSYFSRRKTSSFSKGSPLGSGTQLHEEASWMTSDKPQLSPSQIRIEAQVKDVSMRVVTDMGLYDSETTKGVVVKMDIGV